LGTRDRFDVANAAALPWPDDSSVDLVVTWPKVTRLKEQAVSNAMPRWQSASCGIRHVEVSCVQRKLSTATRCRVPTCVQSHQTRPSGKICSSQWSGRRFSTTSSTHSLLHR
jgi:hypothetical protein